VELDMTWGHTTVHLAESEAPTRHQIAAWRAHEERLPEDAPAEAARVVVWSARTLCGRARGAVLDDPEFDLLGEHRGLVCRSCWRTVERWLSPPPLAPGEDEVVHWLVETALAVGEAMVEGVPAPRLEAVRRRARSALKAAVGGSVRTEAIGGHAVWVRSALVIYAKTPERVQEELHTAMERIWAIEDGLPVGSPSWRRRWVDITGAD
jgi:hypothetical protein